MNKENDMQLSATDKLRLCTIDRDYRLAEMILGIEPAIYCEFNIRPLLTDKGILDLNLKRMELFSGSVMPN